MGKARTLCATHLGSSLVARRSPLVGILSEGWPLHTILSWASSSLSQYWLLTQRCNITIKAPILVSKKKNEDQIDCDPKIWGPKWCFRPFFLIVNNEILLNLNALLLMLDETSSDFRVLLHLIGNESNLSPTNTQKITTLTLSKEGNLLNY